MKDSNNKFAKYRSFLLLDWYVLIIVTILLTCYPVNRGIIRLYFLVSIPLIFAGMTLAIWHKRKIRWIPMVVFAIPLLFFVFPGREINKERLLKRYINCLKKYEGVRFVWGGENSFGVDCSGLTRKGLINANLSEAVWTVNPTCLRRAFKLWWYDCSAKALKANYRSWTHSQFQADSINKIDLKKLQAGNFAVTMDGIHVLIYLGDGKWIEADPEMGKVIIVPVPIKNNSWFDIPVQILQWKEFE